MAKTKTIAVPVAVKLDGVYHPPGTELELDTETANRMTATHGLYDGPVIAKNDPANTQAIGVDAASIAALNEHNQINYPGDAAKFRAIGETDELEDDEITLDDLKKDQLIAYAKERNIEIDETANKPVILAAIKDAEAKASA